MDPREDSWAFSDADGPRCGLLWWPIQIVGIISKRGTRETAVYRGLLGWSSPIDWGARGFDPREPSRNECNRAASADPGRGLGHPRSDRCGMPTGTDPADGDWSRLFRSTSGEHPPPHPARLWFWPSAGIWFGCPGPRVVAAGSGAFRRGEIFTKRKLPKSGKETGNRGAAAFHTRSADSRSALSVQYTELDDLLITSNPARWRNRSWAGCSSDAAGVAGQQRQINP